MKPRIFRSSIVVVLLTLLSACNQEQAPVNYQIPPDSVKTPAIVAPFGYHKLIESSPGNYFDVFSWGRGKESAAAYIILRTDSVNKIYSTTSGNLEGPIIDVFNTDMNMDGNPEILIESKAKDTINYINIYAYEFVGNRTSKLNFPQLTAKSKKGYRGGDEFSIKGGNLIREFPLYDGSGKTAKPSGKKKVLQYGLRDDVFTVSDISPVDTVKSARPVVTQVKKKPAVVIKKKKKHRRHH